MSTRFPPVTKTRKFFSKAVSICNQEWQLAYLCWNDFRSAVEDSIRQSNQIGRFVFTHVLQSLDRATMGTIKMKSNRMNMLDRSGTPIDIRAGNTVRIRQS